MKIISSCNDYLILIYNISGFSKIGDGYTHILVKSLSQISLPLYTEKVSNICFPYYLTYLDLLC